MNEGWPTGVIFVIFFSAEAAEKRWSSLRDMFTRENRKQKLPPSGSGHHPFKEWALYRPMLFLIPRLTIRPGLTGIVPV